MQRPEAARVEELVLAWWLTRADGRSARGTVARALKPFTAHRWSTSEWSAHLDKTLGALLAQGLLRRGGRQGFALTREGQLRALAFLGLERVPRRLTWRQIRRTFLVARALDLPATRGGRLGQASGLRAVLVQKHLGLEHVGERSLKAIQDELCWKQLGVTTDKPFTLPHVQAFLLGQRLSSTRELTPAQALEQLAARQVGARRVDADSLRLAALQSWILPVSPPAPPPPPPVEEALPAFAERVMKTARALKEGRVGADRVFISHVQRALGESARDERTFKQRLLSANQQRLLSLSRADMVEWMDARDVSASAVRHLGSTFHLIVL